MFNALADEKKVQRRAERNRLREEQMQAKLSLSADEVKGRSWADVSDDDEAADAEDAAQLAHLESSDEEDQPDSPARSPVHPHRVPAVGGKGYPAAEPKALSKKAKKEMEKKKNDAQLDDLDAVLAEFGVDVPKEPDAAPADSKRMRKKKAKEDRPDGSPEPATTNGTAKALTPEPGRSAEPSEVDAGETAGMDEETKAAALEALKKKAAAKKGAKAKSATSAAAAEAKKRAANVAKPKRDKNAFDR